MRRRPAVVFGLAGASLLLAMTLYVSLGSAPIPFDVVWSIILHHLAPGLVTPDWSPGRDSIVWNIRLPRAVLAALAGAGLGMAGAVMQGVTRNALADPHLLGVSAGAAFGANLALLLTGNVFGPMTVVMFAFAGALGATALVLVAAHVARAHDQTSLVLGGVAIAFVIGAGANVLIMFADPRNIPGMVFWMLGGFGMAQWSNLLWPAAAVLVCGLAFLASAARLNAMAMGDETAASLGVPVRQTRLGLLVINALLTGAIVAFTGMIGFVGLMTPHLMRLVLGGDNRLIIPASALCGALFLVSADIVARTLLTPNDMPVGVVTGLVGGVFFLVLLRRRG